MAGYLTIWMVLFMCTSLSLCEETKEETSVLVLTKENFEDVIKDQEYVLVEFYAPWCGHCQALAPEYEKAAKALKDKKSSIKLGKVDVTVEKELGEQYKIQGFPTLKFFKSGEEPIEYTGGRDANGILSWLDRKTGPPCVEISEQKDLDKLIEDDGVVIGGFFDDVTSTNAKLFEKMAAEDESRKYAFITGKPVWKENKAKDTTIIVFKNFDEKMATYEGEYDEKSMKKFILETSRPDIFAFSSENSERIFGSGIQHYLLILSSKNDDKHSDRIKQATPVAQELKSEVIFIHLDTSSDEFNDIVDYLGINKESDLPTFVAFSMESARKYHPKNKEITTGNLRKFAKDYLAGKLKPSLKSAELPEDWDSQPVKILVSSNFKEVALDHQKDVFVEFYAPWCGHCKNLEPIWDKLGEHFKERSDLVIAKMDATGNEVEEVEVEGFPTLKMFKKKTNEVVDYTGGRDFDSLVKFIETGEQQEDPEVPEKDGEDESKSDDDDYADYGDYEDEDEDEDDEKDKREKDEL